MSDKGDDKAKRPSPRLAMDEKPPGIKEAKMEARIAVIESDVGHIRRDISDLKSDVRELRRDGRTDFRLLFGAIVAVALGLAGIMAKGFHWF
jgi:hypothetical protein